MTSPPPEPAASVDSRPVMPNDSHEYTESSRTTDVLLLDGECGLCNRLALFLMPRLKDSASLEFVAIQSERGERLIATLSERQRRSDTVYLLRGGRVHIRSAATIRGLLHLRWWWAMWMPVAWLVPLPVRDVAYRMVSRYRHRLFRPPQTCAF